MDIMVIEQKPVTVYCRIEHRIGGLSHRGRHTGASYPDGRAIPPWGLVGTGSALVLRTPQKNIERYRDLLKTKLTKVKLQNIDKRPLRRAFCDSDIAICEHNRPLMDADAIVFDSDCVPAPVVNDFPSGLK